MKRGKNLREEFFLDGWGFEDEDEDEDENEDENEDDPPSLRLWWTGEDFPLPRFCASGADGV